MGHSPPIVSSNVLHSCVPWARRLLEHSCQQGLLYGCPLLYAWGWVAACKQEIWLTVLAEGWLAASLVSDAPQRCWESLRVAPGITRDLRRMCCIGYYVWQLILKMNFKEAEIHKQKWTHDSENCRVFKVEEVLEIIQLKDFILWMKKKARGIVISWTFWT